MTKQETLRKLGNAVREYRGRTSSPAGAAKTTWLQAPNPHKAKRIRELLGLLKQSPAEQDAALRTIDGFQSFDVCNAWLRTL